MRLLFVFVLLSSVAFGQKTIKKLEKLKMGDAISPFTKNKHSIDERLDNLIYQNKLWPKSAYILNVINVDFDDCDGVCISYYNPEVLFFYKKNKKFTGQLKVNTKGHFSQHTIISFLDGKLNGLFYDSISNTGDPVYVRKGNYKNGYKNRKWTKWKFYFVDSIDNMWIEEQNWKKSKLEGLQKSWWGTGQIKYGPLEHERNYKDGEEVGLHRSWYRNGQLSSESNFKDGVRNGLWKKWNNDGQLRHERNYKDGKQDGLARTWHENGQLESKYKYKDGALISEKCFDEKGNIRSCKW